MYRSRRMYLVAVILCVITVTSVCHSEVKPVIPGTLSVGVPFQIVGDPGAEVSVCVFHTPPTLPITTCTSVHLTNGADGKDYVVPDKTTQLATPILATPLVAGDSVVLDQLLAGSHTFSPVITVSAVSVGDNEREHTDFVGGTLFSANGSNYSQGNVFLALNYDRALWRPGWYSGKDYACLTRPDGAVVREHVALTELDKKKDGWTTALTAPDKLVLCPRTRHPGLNFFFQARLSTIPVNASQSTTTTTPTTAATGTTTTTGPSVASFLAAQKTGQFGGGGYMPFLFAEVPSNKEKTSAFYIAPIARFGFSTPYGTPGGNSTTGSSGSTSGATTTTTTTVLGTSDASVNQLYNYWLGGVRIATADLEAGSIHTKHYFDVGIGKYSNLQSLICKSNDPVSNPKCLQAVTAGGQSSYSGPVDFSLESHTTLLRLEFEGYLEVPTAKSSSFILGMSANTGPSVLDRRAHIDINNKAAEDIEFLIAYKFDITKLFSAVKLIGE